MGTRIMVTEKTVLRLIQIAAMIWERNKGKMSTNGYYIRAGHSTNYY